jgi:hypothetical protein
MTDFEKNHGRDGLMILAAVRYCIGRRTYIVNDCVNWIIENWDSWPDHIQNIIQRDVEESFVRDDEARLGNGYKWLGDDCDRAEWEKVRTLWSNR